MSNPKELLESPWSFLSRKIRYLVGTILKEYIMDAFKYDLLNSYKGCTILRFDSGSWGNVSSHSQYFPGVSNLAIHGPSVKQVPEVDWHKTLRSGGEPGKGRHQWEGQPLLSSIQILIHSNLGRHIGLFSLFLFSSKILIILIIRMV